MKKHQIKNFLAFFAICVLLYPAVILKNVYASNLLIFFSSFVAFVGILGFVMSISYSKVKHPSYSPSIREQEVSKTYKEKVLQTYLDNKHLPYWMDISFYVIIIGILVLFGWWYTAICWTITSSIDFMARSDAEEIKK